MLNKQSNRKKGAKSTGLFGSIKLLASSIFLPMLSEDYLLGSKLLEFK